MILFDFFGCGETRKSDARNSGNGYNGSIGGGGIGGLVSRTGISRCIRGSLGKRYRKLPQGLTPCTNLIVFSPFLTFTFMV